MSKYKKFKQRIFEILGPARKGDILSLLVDIFICALVVLSSVCVIIELVGVPDGVRVLLERFEYVTVGIFIVEYLLRLWVWGFFYPECKN